MRLRYEFPLDKVRKGIHWLEVEEGDGGAYLFQFEDIAAGAKWDSFYPNVEEALSGCEETWGIRPSEWQEVK